MTFRALFLALGFGMGAATALADTPPVPPPAPPAPAPAPAPPADTPPAPPAPTEPPAPPTPAEPPPAPPAGKSTEEPPAKKPATEGTAPGQAADLPAAPAATPAPPARPPPPGPLPVVSAAPTCPVDCCPRATCPRVEIVLEGTFSWVEDPEGLVGEAVPPGTPALSWDGNTYDPEVGGRATVRFPLGTRDSLEIRGAWLGQYQAESTQTGAVGFSPPPGSVSPPVTALLSNEAEVWSGEATWWHDACATGCARWSTGIGVRYVKFDETARLDATNAAGLPAFVASNADNQFFGGQLAARVRWDLGRSLELGLTAKGLLGAIRRDVDVSDANIFSGGTHSANSEDTAFGWGAEVEVSALWRLNRCFGVTAGYTALYLGEVVRAHDGMDFSQGSTGVVQAQQATDGILIHGVFVGVQLSF